MASIVKNTGYLYLKVVLNIFISLYTTRLVLNSLGTDDFGIWGIIGGAIAFLSFLNPALSAATQRYLSFYEGQGNIHNQKSIFDKYFASSVICYNNRCCVRIVCLSFI